MKKSKWLLPLAIAAFVALAAPRSSAANSLALTNATVIDVRTGRLLPDETVVIIGDRITALSRHAHIPADAKIVDAKGQFVIPGLWDMHAHALWSADQMKRMFDLFLANGITGIRDMGSPLPVSETMNWRTKVNSGAILGPRIVAAGKLVDGPQPVWPGSIAAGTGEQARDAVETLQKEGVDFIKVYSRLPREAYFALASEAKKDGIPFVGHVPIYVSASEASAAGQRSIEHLSEVLFACSSRESDLRKQLIAASIGNDRDRLRRDQVKVMEAQKRSYQLEIQIVQLMHRAGVRFMTGTDAETYYPAGFGMHTELGLFVNAGFSALEALQAATLNPAEFLGRTKDLGTVDVGKIADLVILEANPLDYIQNVGRIAAVVTAGRYLDRLELNRLLSEAADLANKLQTRRSEN
jgi:imidazolonepropionase-like amidohydrolase